MKKGYTLIELLITITITTILITFGVNAYRLASNKQAIKSQTTTIITTLTQAQKAATSGKTNCLGSEYMGQQVSVTSNQKTLTLTSLCKDGSGLPTIITLTDLTFVETLTFTFRPLSQGVDLPSGNTLNLDYQNNADIYRIEITRSGNINYLGKI